TLATEVGCTAKAVLISSSVQPGPAGLLSAWSSTWAWVRVRAAIFPLRTSASNCSRSSGLKVTTYFFMLGVLRGLVTAMFPKNTQRLLTLKITPDEVLGGQTRAHRARNRNRAAPPPPCPPAFPRCEWVPPALRPRGHTGDRVLAVAPARPQSAAPAAWRSAAPSTPGDTPTPPGSAPLGSVWGPSCGSPRYPATDQNRHASADDMRLVVSSPPPRPTQPPQPP